jgi:predicted DNA-binding transcriptional regulator AlpA
MGWILSNFGIHQDESDKLVTSRTVAGSLGCVSHRTLERWRQRGYGPPWVKIGRAVRYRWSDVEEWLASQTSRS